MSRKQRGYVMSDKRYLQLDYDNKDLDNQHSDAGMTLKEYKQLETKNSFDNQFIADKIPVYQ